MAAQKFYFPLDTVADVTPPNPAADWEEFDTKISRKLVRSPGASTLTTVNILPTACGAGDHVPDADAYHRSYVYGPLAAQTIAQTTTVRGQFQTSENNAGNNLFLAMKLYIMSGAGAAKEALLAITRKGTEPTTSLRNTTFAATALAGSGADVTVEQGDYLVVEIGLGGDPVATSGTQNHRGSIRWGETAASGDLPVNESEAGTGYRPWIEFSVDITEYVPPVITSIDTDNNTVDTRTSVPIVGTTFGASETGSAKVEISNNATYGSGTVVEIDVTAWSATSITVTLQQESDSAALATLFTLPLSPAYLWVTESGGGHNTTGFQFTLNPAGAAWLEDVNTETTVDVSGGNVQLRLRIGIKNTGGSVGASALEYAYSKNSGAYAPLTNASSNIKTFTTTYYADGDDVPQILTSGNFQADNNAAEESTGAFTLTAGLAAGYSAETEIALEVIADDVADGDTIDIQVRQADDTVFDEYTVTARIVIEAGAAGYSLDLEAGSYPITGAALTPLAGRMLNLEVGTILVTGAALSPLAGRALNLEAATYPITGAAMTTLADRVLNLAAGSYPIAGAALSALAGRSLNLEVGTYPITGADLITTRGFLLNLEAGAYAVLGADLAALAGRALYLEAGTYLVLGADTALNRGFNFNLEPGTYEIDGADLSVLAGRALDLESGIHEITGADLTALAGRMLNLEAGVHEIAGADLGALAGRMLTLEAGVYEIIGGDLSPLAGRSLNLESGTYLILGADAILDYSAVTITFKAAWAIGSNIIIQVDKN